jgi:riboflavin synthase
MFTGLVEERGRIASVEIAGGGRRLWIGAERVLADTRTGDSIAVNGCCLTAVAIEPRRFAVEVVPETMARTTAGEWGEGDAVNLERSLRADQRLGGHLVLGHVDGVGTIESVATEEPGCRVRIALPPGLARYVAEKGSLAVDGVSLTVARAHGSGCEVALIPHTLDVAIASEYRPGRRVNLEVDLVARYVARLLEDAGIVRGIP